MAPQASRRERNPEKTRASLLSAGIREFSRRGYSGARVDRIAAAANTNKQSIYRYFGSKRGLFSAALEEGLVSHLREPEPGKGGPLEQVEQAVEAIHELLRSRPELSRLLLWEMLEGVRARHDQRYGFVYRRRGFLERGKADGTFDPDLDIDQTLVDISALCVYPFVMTPSYRILRDGSPYERKEFDKRLLHVRSVLRTLLGAPNRPNGD